VSSPCRSVRCVVVVVVVQDGGGVQSRWELIHTALTAEFKSSLDVRVRRRLSPGAD